MQPLIRHFFQKKAVRILIFVILFVLLVAPGALALWLASFVMTGKRQTLDEARKWQSAHYDISFYDETPKDVYTVTCRDGYVLHAEYLHAPESGGRTVILSHGYTDNRIGSLKYARMYLELGYDCLIYDLRGHGENESTFTTYSIREGRDIADLVSDTRQRYPGIRRLGLHGESLGAASSVASLRYAPEVDFVVADCGFSDIDNVLREGYRQAHAPVFLVDLADFGARPRYHYALKDMRPIDSLDGNTVPILFIHGTADSFILPENSRRMAERTHGPLELCLIEGAGHAESILTAPDEYRRAVETFLDRYGKEQP